MPPLRVWVVKLKDGRGEIPITDPEVAAVYRDAGYHVKAPDHPDFDMVRWLVATRPRRRRR